MYFFLKYIVTLFYKKLIIKIVVCLLRESCPWIILCHILIAPKAVESRSHYIRVRTYAYGVRTLHTSTVIHIQTFICIFTYMYTCMLYVCMRLYVCTYTHLVTYLRICKHTHIIKLEQYLHLQIRSARFSSRKI